MPRHILDAERLHANISDKVANNHRAIVDEVVSTVDQNDVVVVGMKVNPFPKKARALLKERGTDFRYLEYGSYVSMWRERTAIKMWSGWPTFPMVFVKGSLVGGFSELKALADDGSLDTLLKS